MDNKKDTFQEMYNMVMDDTKMQSPRPIIINPKSFEAVKYFIDMPKIVLHESDKDLEM